MGLIYRKTQDYFDHSQPDQLIVEIGSDRYEGSTAFFAEKSYQHHMWLKTVDIDGDCAHRIRRTANPYINRVQFFQQEGCEWARKYHCESNIHTLYLDNFDWDWEPGHPNRMIDEQRVWYALYGIEMNNTNCQNAHWEQMVHMMPWMAESSVVCLDDTYKDNKGNWTGKGGLVVPFLLINAYEILHYEEYGVILGSGKYSEKVH